MIKSDIVVQAQRANYKTKVLEWHQVDLVDLSDEEFAAYWTQLTDDRDRFVVANTLRKCCVGLSDYGDTESP